VHEPKTNLKRLGSTTFAGDLAAPPLFEFVAEPKSETDTSVSSKSNTKTKVKKSRTCTPQRALTRLSALTLILLVVWILASLAQKMADLQADVAFVADEVRDLRMVALERERERERARWWRAAEPEETQAEPSAAGSAKVKETGKAKGDINEKGQGQERKDNMDKGNADEPRPGASATTSPKSTALVPPSHAEHGVGRVVFRPWLAWKDLPV
jgi:hypothetical protein